MANENLIECYGKRKECVERAKCPLGEPCLSKFREILDEYHFQKQNVLLPDVLFAPVESEMMEMPVYETDEDAQEEQTSFVQFGEIQIPKDSYTQVLAIIRQIAEMYFSTPKLFDALMHKIFKGMNQSDLAKKKGVSRQYINREILKEVGIAQKRNDAHERKQAELADKITEYECKIETMQQFLTSLTDRERFVYVHCFENGETHDSVSRQMGISTKTVQRLSIKIRSKLTKDVHLKNGTTQKS